MRSIKCLGADSGPANAAMEGPADARVSPASLGPAAWVPFSIACLGVALFTAMDVTMKSLSLASGAYNALYWRSIAGVVLATAVYAHRRPELPDRHTLILHATRSAVMTLMALSWFWGLARVPMAEAIALTFIAPLIAIYLAHLFLAEKACWNAVLGSVLGLGGVGIMVFAQSEHAYGSQIFAGVMAILFSAILYAINLVMMRKMARSSPPAEVAFFQNIVVAALLSLAAPFHATVPEFVQLPEIIASAALAMVSLMLLSWAYGHMETQLLATVEYTAFGWGALYGWLFFGETIGGRVIAGTALICFGCFLAFKPRKKESVCPATQASN